MVIQTWAPRLGLLLFIVLPGSTPKAFGAVELNSGNFAIGYTDDILTGGFEIKVARTYKSKSGYRGIFGWGWGSELETYLSVLADGSIVVHEDGGGNEINFYRAPLDPGALEQLVQRMAAAARRINPSLQGEQLEKYIGSLRNDRPFRDREWETLLGWKAVEPIMLPAGTRLESTELSYQIVQKTENGYWRTFDSGRREIFNEAGKLVRISEGTDYLELIYDTGGRLDRLRNNADKSVLFRLNGSGQVESIRDSENRTAFYLYNKEDELVFSVDTHSNLYRYEYDLAGRHNMTAIAYADGTTSLISYYPRSSDESVMSVSDRSNALSTFRYTAFDANDYRVDVETRNSRNVKLSAISYHFYYHPSTAQRGQQIARILKTVDAETTDTTYDERCLRPSRTETSEGVFLFRYDSGCHPVRRDAPREITSLEYLEGTNKLAKLEILSKTDLGRILEH
jgi:YD repeat-containing protein